MPLQNMSHEIRNDRSVAVTGSKTAASHFGFGSRAPEPAMTSTLPLCISATWTGLIDINSGSVVHWPVRYGAAAGGRRSRVPCRCSAGSTERLPRRLLLRADGGDERRNKKRNDTDPHIHPPPRRRTQSSARDGNAHRRARRRSRVVRRVGAQSP